MSRMRDKAGIGALAICALIVLTGSSAAEDDEPLYIPGPDGAFDVEVHDRGYTVTLTEAAVDQAITDGVGADVAADVLCEGTYTLYKVNNTLVWGSQHTCNPSLPASYAPQRIDVTLQGTCNEAWCVAWYDEAGPLTSGYTYSRVATATTATTCDSSTERRFRIEVRVRMKGGQLDYGTARSWPWSGTPCNV